MRLIGSALVVMLIAGCAAPWHRHAQQLVLTGQCQAARRAIEANENDPGMKAGWIAATFADCDKNMPEAIRWFTLSARYGNPVAQQSLAQLRQPVPPADLARGVPRQESAAEAFLRGYNSTSSPVSPSSVGPGSVTCDAQRSTMGPSTMNQTYQINCR